MAREEKEYILTVWERAIKRNFLYYWIVFKMC